MAIVRAQEVSTVTFRCSYHVFLSFGGKDIRKTFIDHLYTALDQAGFRTFRDDDELEKGENIKSQLHKAIRESRISIIVFSESYASSTWCLDELVRILERKKTAGHIVLPVFYHMHPSEVANQTGSFAEAFAEHEKTVKAEADENTEDGMYKVKRWRTALAEVAELAGLHLENGYESEFIHKIVKNIGDKLKRIVLNVAWYPVGIEHRVKEINLWLQDKSTGVGIAVIYGIGGIGKTTIAKTVYNQNFESFEGSSFLANIRETLEQPNGLIRLQKQLISDISRRRKEKISSVDAGLTKVKDAICHKRILVILDDVDEEEQFSAIIGMPDWLCLGSKIIITTRHEKLFNARETCKLFEVEDLNYFESLRLFSWYAFKQDHPTEFYEGLVEKFVRLCGGIPLALQVLGSSLFGRSVDVWESALKKLERVFDGQIFKVLKISYDCLDRHDKDLFLHIASFFVRKDRDFVVKILDKCNLYPVVGIQNLLDRCLIAIDNNDKLIMHQLLRDMGREIIFQESPREPGQRSRVWHHKDVLKILREKTGTKTILGFALNLNELKEDEQWKTFSAINARKRQSKDVIDELRMPFEGSSMKRRRLTTFSWHPKYSSSMFSFFESNDIKLETNAFSTMSNIQLLQINYARVSEGEKLNYAGIRGRFEDFPKKLRWLCWRGFPLKSIPSDFYMENLVALDMRSSSLIEVWRGTKFLGLLKILNLSHSEGLTKAPDFSGLPNLERLILKYCTNLVDVESVGELGGLLVLNLKGCKCLAKLPSKISQLKSLEILILSGCSKLVKLPMELENMKVRTLFSADGTAIDQLPSIDGESKNVFQLSVKSLQSLFWSWVSPIRRPKSTSLLLEFMPRALKSLELADCNLTNGAIPILFSSLSSLKHLNLGGNPISQLPESIRGLTMLKSLILHRCTRLQSLPELPSGLEKLEAYECTSLERITNLPNLLTQLDLSLHECQNLVEVRSLFKLEPITNFDVEIIKNLGILDLEFINTTEVSLRNNLTSTTRKGSVQGLYEFGIFSTFLPGSKVPGWFSINSTEPDARFVVPHLDNVRTWGINICIVYETNELWVSHHLNIHNKSKDLRWKYSPTCFGESGNDEDVMWLSYWQLGNKVEGGDQVEIVVDFGSEIQMKEWGFRLLCMEPNKEDVDTQSSNSKDIIQRPNFSGPFNNVIAGDWSAYDVLKNAYYLCLADLMFHQELPTMTDLEREREIRYLFKDYFKDYNHSPWKATHHLEFPETRGFSEIAWSTDREQKEEDEYTGQSISIQ